MTKPSKEWTGEFEGGVIVCDLAGVILSMNKRGQRNYAAQGGAALVGKNLLDCHPSPARAKLEKLLASGGTNVYTIEKAGVRKLIYQAPWFESGERRGMVELSLEIPVEMPHFIRRQ